MANRTCKICLCVILLLLLIAGAVLLALYFTGNLDHLIHDSSNQSGNETTTTMSPFNTQTTEGMTTMEETTTTTTTTTTMATTTERVNPCDTNPCMNGGQCFEDGDGYTCDCGALCTCGTGHYGTNCEYAVYEASLICQDRPDGKYPHPSECNRFVTCTSHFPSTGTCRRDVNNRRCSNRNPCVFVPAETAGDGDCTRDADSNC